MKRSLVKQLMVSALFTCSLSADVPDVEQISKRPTPRDVGQAPNLSRSERDAQRPMPTVGLVANQTGAYSFNLYNDSAIRPLSSAVCRPSWSAPDPMACVLSAAWPLGGSGFHRLDRSCVRWELPSRASQETINVPTNPFDTAFFVTRYRMPLALQESVWPVFADLPAPAEAGFAKAGALRAGRPRSVGSRLCPGESPWQVSEPAQSRDVASQSDRLDMDAMILRLKKVFAKEGVPQQWVWVAQVESALNPRATSSAGAVGLFQLMPGTAQRFGLQTTPVDDRMVPEKSAGAAAQYLKFLHQEFGCWSLALAAYNAGEGRVKEIMKKRNACTFTEVERYLPAETRAYVPKVMAIVALREDRLHGVPCAYWMP